MHTNILNKVLAALTGLLLCTESAVAQVQGENGYWKFRDATVFGVSNGTEEGADSRTDKEARQYDKGHFTVTQQYTEGGQTFSAEATGVVQGLSKQVKPGDEMTVSISLSAPGGSGPRGNKIWGRAIVVYGKLAWTPENWEDDRIDADRSYTGEFTDNRGESLVRAADGQKASATLKNNAVKGKGVKTTKVVKEAVKNLTQNATSDAMGKVIDPDGIGGQAFKQIVDDGRGELVSRVFE